MFSFRRTALSLLVFASALTGCMDYKLHEVKDFKILVDTDNVDLQKAISILSDDYNAALGFQALTVVSNPEEANSIISFKTDLRDASGHKLGLGQWMTTTSEKKSYRATGTTKETVVAYAMDIEFDKDNFETKIANVNDKDSNEYKHLFHLFSHEVGHGMQLSHAPSKSSVMYCSIPEKPVRAINYEEYFSNIRSFLTGDALPQDGTTQDAAGNQNDCKTAK